MRDIRQVWLSVSAKVRGFVDRNLTARGILAGLWILATGIPDMFGRKDFWSRHLSQVWRFIYAHSTWSTLIAGLFIIWFDHRRVLRRRGARPHDIKTLEGRVLQLRDDLVKFQDKLGARIDLDFHAEKNDWAAQRKQQHLRNSLLHHGFHRHFTKRLEDIFHELGEQDKLPLGLELGFRQALSSNEQGKLLTDEDLKQLITGLTNAIKAIASQR